MSDTTNNAGPVYGNLVQAHAIHGDVVLHQRLHVAPSDLERMRLREEGWRSADQRLKAYLRAAVKVALEHPYPGVLPNTQPPPLSEVYLEQVAEDERSGQVPAELIFRMRDDCLVDGGPGSGKSSLLRMGVIRLVELLATDPDQPQVPVRILASDLLADRPFAESLAAATRADFGAGAMRGWSAGFFSEPPVEGGRWLVMVDGLDEVAGVRNRGQVLRQLSRIAHDHNDTHRLLVATRPMLSDDRRQVERWSRVDYRLRAFERHQLPTFAKAWFEALRLSDPEFLARRFTASVDRMSLGTLATTPLMATMLCQLFAARPDAELPAGRRDIYRRFTDLLYSRVLAGTSTAERTEPSLARLRESHLDVARAIAKRRQEGGTEPTVDLLAELTSHARPQGLPAAQWRDLVYEFMQSTGLFSPQRGDLKFIHQTIAEFLAAEHVAVSRWRSLRAHVELFGLTFGRNPEASSLRTRRSAETEWNNTSYLRFLLAAWLADDFTPVRVGLTRMIGRGDRSRLDAIRLLLTLVEDGVELGDRLRERTAASLRSVANDGRQDFSDRCTAAKLLWKQGDRYGLDLLRRFATGRRPVGDRVEAAMMLDEHGTAVLTDMLREPLAPRDRLEVAHGLARIDPASARLAFRELAVHGGNPHDIRAKAAARLVGLGDPRGYRLAIALTKESLGSRTEALDAIRVLMRLAATESGMRRQLHEAVAVAAKSRTNPPVVRFEAAKLLLAAQRTSGLRCLGDLARDRLVAPSWRVRAALAHADAGSDQPRSAALLASVVKATWDDLDDDEREEVESALRRLGAANRFPR